MLIIHYHTLTPATIYITINFTAYIYPQPVLHSHPSHNINNHICYTLYTKLAIQHCSIACYLLAHFRFYVLVSLVLLHSLLDYLLSLFFFPRERAFLSQIIVVIIYNILGLISLIMISITRLVGGGACKLDHEKMGYGEIRIRSYNGEIDRARVEDLERRCEVGPSERVFLFTDTMGDPICRIRNSPMYNMLVAETDKEKELVGVIQGSIKVVTVHKPAEDELAKVGYVLGLRVAPLHRRRGIGSSLVRRLEEWFVANDVDYAYMATEKDNEASVKLFVDKLGFVKFRTPAILVNPVNYHPLRLSPAVEISKLETDEAESLYRKYMGSTEFFPDDIGNILRNRLTLGTWVAHPRGETWTAVSGGGPRPSSWAVVSVWNSGELFKLRLGKAPLSCAIYTKSSRLMEWLLPCLKVPVLPDFFRPFGFYFMYGLYREGSGSGKMVRSLCEYVHNMANHDRNKDCKAIVTEVGGGDGVRGQIPHWKLLSCPEDLWCIKALKTNKKTKLQETRGGGLFVDPREV